MSEDCLRINVFTKNIFTNSSELKPVLVHIHGGAFRRGSGTSKTIEPFYILEYDLVVVTFNYRIGALGFLAMGTADCPGNFGFKDQVEALTWVRDNIKYFGGDRDKITVSGHSAGSQSLSMHLISPLSSFLFNRAILMSGSVMTQWEIPTHQYELARKQAEFFGCSTASAEVILSCLRQQSARELSTHDDIFFEYGNYFPLVIWGPVLEPDFGQKQFLTENPSEAILNKGSIVPIMTGIVQDEFARLAKIVLENEQYRNEMINNFSFVAPIVFWYERFGTDKSEMVSNELKTKFFNHNDDGDIVLEWDASLRDLQIVSNWINF